MNNVYVMPTMEMIDVIMFEVSSALSFVVCAMYAHSSDPVVAVIGPNGYMFMEISVTPVIIRSVAIHLSLLVDEVNGFVP